MGLQLQEASGTCKGETYEALPFGASGYAAGNCFPHRAIVEESRNLALNLGSRLVLELP